MGIEERVMALRDKAMEEGWGCEDYVIDSVKSDSDIASAVATQGMPQRIIDTLAGEHLKTPAYNAVHEFINTPKEAWCLVLAGPKGCGKSTAAAYYLWEKARMSEGEPSRALRWWTASRVSRVSGYNAELEKMMKVPHMIIDDLGVEYLDKNGYFNHRLDEVIDDRYSNYRKTIITTNLNAQDFQTRYGERITSRIREGFKHADNMETLYVNCTAKSLRV